MASLIPGRPSLYGFSLAVLAFNILIVLGGALVRATGSGAGCGAHWPLCDGTVLPVWDSVHRVIEFSHRASVGVGIVLVGLLWVGIRRAFAPGHPARTWVNYTVLFTVTESLIGAGLVLFKLVGLDQSVRRSVAVSAHLVNTFLLVASLTLTAWWCGSRAPARLKGQGAVAWLLGAALVGLVLVGATGAVTALGETLFPAGSVSEIGSPVSANAHFLRQLRVYHPFAAVLAGAHCAAAAWIVAALRPGSAVRTMAFWVVVLVVTQIGFGFINLMMLAPLAMQLIHLLLADALWVALVLLAASALAEDAPRAVRAGAGRLSAEGMQ